LTADEIITDITKLRNGKATGPFSIPIYVLKISIKNVISQPLATLFNISLETGIVLTQFKLANLIIPVYKKGSLTCLGNYRPISLLSIFNKLLFVIDCGILLRRKIFFMRNNMDFV
jgi:hypothetical protein